MKEYSFEIKPMGKPRMTKRDVWAKRPCVVRYREFSDELRWAAKRNDFKLSDSIESITFVFAPAKSWSKKRKAECIGKPHKQKPDIDNVLKSLLDVLAKDSEMEDDSEVWRIGKIEKIWGASDKIIIVQR